jgi:hypothetical protein
MLMSPQTHGSSDANCQDTSSGLSCTRATTTSLGGSTGSASAKYPEAQGIIGGDSLSLSFSFSSTIRPFSGAGGGIYMHLGGSSLGGIAI